MFSRLMPTEGRFFDLFNAHADIVVESAKALVTQFSDLSQSAEAAAKYLENLDALEQRADNITHETIALLHKSFITPFDRNEIHQLISGMDDIVDLMLDASELVSLYDIQRPSKEAMQLAEVTLACCERVRIIVGLLAKAGENTTAILKTCAEIDRLESDADRVMRSAMSRLFRDEADVREVLKMKALYEQLESISDRCKDVAHTVQSIVLENT